MARLIPVRTAEKKIRDDKLVFNPQVKTTAPVQNGSTDHNRPRLRSDWMRIFCSSCRNHCVTGASASGCGDACRTRIGSKIQKIRLTIVITSPMRATSNGVVRKVRAKKKISIREAAMIIASTHAFARSKAFNFVRINLVWSSGGSLAGTSNFWHCQTCFNSSKFMSFEELKQVWQ